jgi:hypothetical protein
VTAKFTLPQLIAVMDLIAQRQTTAGIIDYVKATRTGAAGVQLDDESSPPVVEGALKPEIGYTFTPAQAKGRNCCRLDKGRRQTLDDNEELRAFIDSE